jgi:hypothetical protein
VLATHLKPKDLDRELQKAPKSLLTKALVTKRRVAAYEALKTKARGEIERLFIGLPQPSTINTGELPQGQTYPVVVDLSRIVPEGFDPGVPQLLESLKRLR